MMTGFFANTVSWTKVHLVENGKPICGSLISKDKSFQWNATYPVLNYVECKRCKNIFRKRMIELKAEKDKELSNEKCFRCNQNVPGKMQTITLYTHGIQKDVAVCNICFNELVR